MKWLLFLLAFIVIGCSPAPKLVVQKTTSDRKTGSALFKEAAAYDWRKRDSMVLTEILKGGCVLKCMIGFGFCSGRGF